MDFAFDVELVALDLERGSLCFGQDQSLLGHVLFNLLKGNVGVCDVVGLAKLGQTLRLASQTRLNFVHVEECLSADFAGVWAQEDVLTGLLLHLVCQSNGFFKLKFFEQGLCELGKAV